MSLFFAFVIALFMTIVLIPVVMRLSGRLQLIDRPTDRKRHLGAIPRSGGIAIVLSALVPALLWMPLNRGALGFLIASAIIFLFGLLDDRYDIGFKWKLVGQVGAAMVLVHSGFVIYYFPLLGLEPVPDYVAYPLTVVFLVGVTNAVNMSDGLDGLAAGCALITLAIIAILAYQVDGFGILLVALSIMGGIIGFLRYNTHPAVVFLGDAGSQFLGFTVAALTVRLISHVHSALSPALPALLLGIPLLDLIWVMALRARSGMSIFSPDRRHFHYRLEDLGFRHHESVGLIYALHGLLASSALFLRYQSDWLILAAYLSICGAIMAFFYWAKASSWRLHHDVTAAQVVDRRNLWLRRMTWLPALLHRILAYGVALFLVGGAVIVSDVPHDFVITSIILIAVLAVAAMFLSAHSGLFTRVGLCITSVLIAYLLVPFPVGNGSGDAVLNGFFVVLIAVLIVAFRVTRRDLFQITPQDLLVVFFALVIPNLSGHLVEQFPVGQTTFRLVVVFYVAEFLLSSSREYFQDRHSYRVLRVAPIVSLAILAGRGGF